LLTIIRLQNGKFAEAEDAIRPVYESNQADVEALNLLANALVIQGKMDEGIDLLEKAVELEPDSSAAKMRLGAGMIGAGEQDSGLEYVESAIQMNPQLQQADILLILNHLKRKQFEQALEAAEAYRKRNPDSATPLNLLGRIHLEVGQEPEARKAFKEALLMVPGDPSANHGLAAMAERSKDYDSARAYYQAVLDRHENHLASLLKLATLDALENKEELLIEHLEQAREAQPKSMQPRLLLARYYLVKGKPDKVLEFFVDADEAQVNHPAVLDVIARSELARSKFSSAKRTLRKLISQQPNSAEAHYLMSQAHAGLDETGDRKRALENAVKSAPNHFPARLALAQQLWLDKKYDDVSEHLEVLKGIAADNAGVLQLELSLAEQHGDEKEALRLSEEIYRKSPSTSSMLLLAKNKWRLGEREEALALKEQWIEKHPEDVSARVSLANSYIAKNNIDAAVEQYLSVLEKDENNLIALNDLAWFLRVNRPKEALEYAQRLNELKPNVANFMDTLAVVLMENGEIEKAQSLINRVLLKAPKDKDIRYHSAMIDVAAGNKARAQKTLVALLSDKEEFSQKKEAEKLLAELKAGN
jgi:putative PEP-CTERM system TPR-repeat lipoprotein